MYVSLPSCVMSLKVCTPNPAHGVVHVVVSQAEVHVYTQAQTASAGAALGVANTAGTGTAGNRLPRETHPEGDLG